MRTRDTLPLATVLLAALVAGCSDGEARLEPPESTESSAPADADSTTPSSPRPMSQHRLDKLTHLLERVEHLDRIPPGFELRDVDYTSRKAAVAYFVDTRVRVDRGTIIATTDDNWAHATRLRISHELADLVDYLPLGEGAVGIKAQDQWPRRSYPPFVLYPGGETKPLRVAEDTSLDADSELLGIGLYNLIGDLPVDPGDGLRTDGDGSQGMWAADVEAAEIYPIPGSPLGDVRGSLPGRNGSLMTTVGYRNGVGDGVWRFETSTDKGLSWDRRDVALPLGVKYLWRYADESTLAVGPGRLQAIAMSDMLPDLPKYLWELWWTGDEKEFRRVELPWDRLRFGGMAFTPDGALLIAEVTGSEHYCDELACNRPGQIWRLASPGAAPKLVADAPRLFGPFWAVGIYPSGGWIVARTGMRTVALSRDGHRWTEVTPGARDVSGR
ncbi:hypothetical protein IEZ26_10525 [Nocardioides cavernae]|uniref:Exo-alpha-sialidase n=1 Tax=Nocardioides cavernae TaxID=1921566 RepID=A0ABR8NCU8_9ACTN|nr:hypothetical protein [Nocardioides cavernae]MBD3925056.1 hypothetical protein [Nocardioides cavernae]MBM7514570.1 hypothetical protein [Nocardioides cavernae]